MTGKCHNSIVVKPLSTGQEALVQNLLATGYNLIIDDDDADDNNKSNNMIKAMEK